MNSNIKGGRVLQSWKFPSIQSSGIPSNLHTSLCLDLLQNVFSPTSTDCLAMGQIRCQLHPKTTMARIRIPKSSWGGLSTASSAGCLPRLFYLALHIHGPKDYHRSKSSFCSSHISGFISIWHTKCCSCWLALPGSFIPLVALDQPVALHHR